MPIATPIPYVDDGNSRLTGMLSAHKPLPISKHDWHTFSGADRSPECVMLQHTHIPSFELNTQHTAPAIQQDAVMQLQRS